MTPRPLIHQSDTAQWRDRALAAEAERSDLREDLATLKSRSTTAAPILRLFRQRDDAFALIRTVRLALDLGDLAAARQAIREYEEGL